MGAGQGMCYGAEKRWRFPEVSPSFHNSHSQPEFKRSTKRLNAADFVQGRILGVGGSAVTRLALHNPTGRHYALKVQFKGKLLKQLASSKKEPLEPRLREPKLLRTLQHPFIVGVLGSFQDARCLYLAMEYVPGGELMRHISEWTCFDAETARFYAGQVVEALQYLHDLQVIYRSLKPEDIILAADGYAKLIDFGFAKELPAGKLTYTLCGTPEYLAPEVLLNQGHGKPVDWYSLGVLIYEMMVGKSPFQADVPMAVYQNILSGEVSFPRSLDKASRGLISKLMQSNPNLRFGSSGGAEAVKKAVWFDGLDWQKLLAKRLRAPYLPSLHNEVDQIVYTPEEEMSKLLGSISQHTEDIHPSEDIFVDLW